MPAFLKAVLFAEGSKKAGALVAIVAGAAVVAATGGIAWPAWLALTEKLTIAYLAAQGISDAAERYGKGKQPAEPAKP